MSALANPEVGKYVNEYFVSSFQKVATFKIVGKARSRAATSPAYFCAPDGRVLHGVAGPVDAATFLREAKWVVETAKKAIEGEQGRRRQVQGALPQGRTPTSCRQEYGLVVEPVTFDPPEPQDPKSALTYSDPTGRPLAPKLPPPPIDGPDVTLGDKAPRLQTPPPRRPARRRSPTAAAAAGCWATRAASTC